MIYRIYFVAFSLLLILSCSSDRASVEAEKINWEKRTLSKVPVDSTVESGSTYLSIYSQIYSQNEKNLRDLTVTVSMRNPNGSDTLYIKEIRSYDTEGNEIKAYIERPVYVLPMETLELVIDEQDTHNGTGGNFIFDWWITEGSHEPLFEAVMISTANQQGISFVTTGKRIH